MCYLPPTLFVMPFILQASRSRVHPLQRTVSISSIDSETVKNTSPRPSSASTATPTSPPPVDLGHVDARRMDPGKSRPKSAQPQNRAQSNEDMSRQPFPQHPGDLPPSIYLPLQRHHSFLSEVGATTRVYSFSSGNSESATGVDGDDLLVGSASNLTSGVTEAAVAEWRKRLQLLGVEPQTGAPAQRPRSAAGRFHVSVVGEDPRHHFRSVDEESFVVLDDEEEEEEEEEETTVDGETQSAEAERISPMSSMEEFRDEIVNSKGVRPPLVRVASLLGKVSTASPRVHRPSLNTGESNHGSFHSQPQAPETIPCSVTAPGPPTPSHSRSAIPPPSPNSLEEEEDLQERLMADGESSLLRQNGRPCHCYSYM